MNFRLLVPVILAAYPGVVGAATVSINMLGSAVASSGSMSPDREDFVFNPAPFEALAASRSETADAMGVWGSASSSAEYAVDGTRGQMRFRMDAELVPNEEGVRGFATSLVQLGVSEDFSVTGSGIMTVGMAVSAFWDTPFMFLNASVTFSGSDTPFDNFGTESIGYSTSGTSEIEAGVSGSISNVLVTRSFEILPTQSTDISLTWFMQGALQLPGDVFLGNFGVLDVFNTANIFVRTEGDLVATPRTSGFLSDPAYGGGVMPVPLPAPIVLLLAALASMAAGPMLRRAHSKRAFA